MNQENRLYVLADYVSEKRSPVYSTLSCYIGSDISDCGNYVARLIENAHNLDIDISSIQIVNQAEALRHYGFNDVPEDVNDLIVSCDWLHPESNRRFYRRAELDAWENGGYNNWLREEEFYYGGNYK